MTVQSGSKRKDTALMRKIKQSASTLVDPTNPYASALDEFKKDMYAWIIMRDREEAYKANNFFSVEKILPLGVVLSFDNDPETDLKIAEMDSILSYYPEITRKAFEKYQTNVENSVLLQEMLRNGEDYSSAEAQKLQGDEFKNIVHNLNCTIALHQEWHPNEPFETMSNESKAVVRNSFMGRML